MTSQNPSLYEMLTLNFGGELDLRRVSERDQVILSVLDNMQRILNSRAGTLAHLPDYGLPDMSQILQGMPGSAHGLLSLLSATLLKYEPRLESLSITLLPQTRSGHLEYTHEAQLKELGLVRFGTEFAPEGKVLVRHLKQQQFVSA